MSARQEGRVTIEEDIVFGEGGGRPLQCDVFLPPEHGVGRAAVLLVHGGGWRSGDRTQLRGYAILLALHGFVCVCCEYRLSGESTWPAQIDDVRTAFGWLHANADRYGVDRARVCVSGNSAGGHLALMLAATSDQRVAVTVAIYPPTQVRVDPGDESVRALLGRDATRAMADAASPISYVDAAFPPTMLVHGNADEIVPVSASFAMYEALSNGGASVALHVFDGVPHAFDTDRDLGRQVADLIVLFLDRNVRRS